MIEGATENEAKEENRAVYEFGPLRQLDMEAMDLEVVNMGFYDFWLGNMSREWNTLESHIIKHDDKGVKCIRVTDLNGMKNYEQLLT
jgi:hypothetical protein